ncbi:conserved hypothetical protein, partial [Ricinus communis]
AANWLGLAIYYTPLHGVALGLPRIYLEHRLGCPIKALKLTHLLTAVGYLETPSALSYRLDPYL